MTFLVLNRVDVRRTPGIRSPFTVKELCSGINLIYGPNASGKTTTALAIQSILWPDTPVWRQGSVGGHFVLDGASWVVDFDTGSLRCQRDGVDVSPRSFVGPNTQDRYVLKLPDLLATEDPSFAAAILRESAGGYDLQAAVTSLGYRGRVSRPGKELSELKKAAAAVRTARQTQAGLADRESRISELRQQLERSRESVRRSAQLRQVLDLRKAQWTLRDAQEELDQYPKILDRCSGDELQTLAKLRSDHESASDRLTHAEQALTDARGMLEQSGLGEMELPPGLVKSLRERLSNLQEANGRIADKERALREATARRDSARRRVAESLTDEQIRELDGSGLAELSALARGLEQVKAEQDAADALAGWVGSIEAPTDLERIQKAISWLNLWLRSARTAELSKSDRIDALTVTAAVILIIESLVLTLAVHWLFAVFVAGGIAIIYLSSRKERSAQDTRADLAVEEYGKLGLDTPLAWHADEVEKLSLNLMAQLQQGLLAQEKAQRWAGLESRRNSLAERVSRLNHAVQAAQHRFGSVPNDSAALALLASNVRSWQESDAAVKETTARLNFERSQFQQSLHGTNLALASYGYPATDDLSTILGYMEDLGERVSSASSSREAIDRLSREIRDDIKPEISRRSDAIAEFFARLELEDHDEEHLRALLDQLADYRETKQELSEANVLYREAAAKVPDTEAFGDMSDSELEAELQRAETEGANLTSIRDQIVEIEALVTSAKQKHDLEQALVEEGDAFDILRVARDEENHLLIGWTLGEFIRERTRDRNRPPVFHRARELFARITQGRYQLEFEDGQPPRFRATDTTTGLGCDLDELSSATRVQLLIAVRVAFVETMENGPRLPLIFDEALGNSDEQRARAIIEAIITICREGRQVFYFTAQHDEVGKWQAVLSGHPDLQHVAINLSEVRELADYDRLPSVASVTAAFPSIPAPNGYSYDEYAVTLHVPGLDPRLGAGSVHLWYLETDAARLYQLLSKGITTWGQFQTLVEYGGQRLLPDEGNLTTVDARARMFTAAFEAWLVGRPPKVDRSVIAASGAISDAFFDQVGEICDSLNGSGDALLAALYSNQIRRLQRAKVDQLQTYLDDHGYLDPADPLSHDEIRLRVLAAVAEDIEKRRISIDEVNVALSRLPELVDVSA